jgi:menaquinone-dependent protoporphyrinogen IX oxidase
MADRALVTYASRTGSTAGVAAAIEKTLAAEWWIPDVFPIKEVACGTAYQAVIIGSAV